MFNLNIGTITEDKQMRLQKDCALLASLKSKTASLPKASVSLFHDPIESVNLFNTNLSFHSIDKNINRYGYNDSIGANLPNDNMNTNKTNLSFSLFPYHFQHDTIFSFNLDTPKDIDQHFPIHKTNESFVFSFTPHLHNSLLKVENEPPLQLKEDSFLSTQKQTQVDGEMTQAQEEFESVVVSHSNYKDKEKSENKLKCLHENCDFVFRTLKQKLAHHHKMSPECKKDTIILLNSIRQFKYLLKVLKKKKKVQMNDTTYKYLLTKYEKIMRNLSLSEHVELLTGYFIDNQ